jgi:hypothetical protein
MSINGEGRRPMSADFNPRLSIACGVLLAIAAAISAGAETNGTAGAICIAAFHAERPSPEHLPSLEPIMSQTTWPPSWKSKFTFRIDKKITRTVANDEMVLITGVPADRKVLVEIRLDGKAYEAFRLDLRQEPGHRACFWLYEGYWHWVNEGWDETKGCRCKPTG